MMMRFLVLAAALLLGGCLEAADLAQERHAAPPICKTANGVAVCPSTGKTDPL